MMKIISGGQTGTDRAALDLALQLGIPCSGYCPKGRKSEDGTIPAKYPLTETETDEYTERTILNVNHSDATLVFIDRQADHGTALTISFCHQYEKPCLVVDLSKNGQTTEVIWWLEKNNISILNVAGNRESSSPGIGQKVYDFLLKLWRNYPMPNNQV